MQRSDELPVHFFELPSAVLISKILASLDPKFTSSILPQINKQFSKLDLNAFYWQSKIEKHFPRYVGTNPFNKSTFKKIEAAEYPNFSESEKELVRFIKEEDIESLEAMPITLEMLNKKDPSGMSILMMTQFIDHPRILSCINQKGFEAAVINFSNENGKLDHQKKDAAGRTILYWGLAFERDIETLIYLMKQGSFTELYLNSFQPFHVAIMLGRLDFLKVIFSDETFKDSLGSLLEQRDASEQTPLFLAAKYKQNEIISFLLTAGADFRAAVGISPGQAVNLALTRQNADYGKTAFHWLVQLNNLEMVKLFIEKFPDLLDEIDIFGETPLIWAVRSGHTQIVEFLLDKGANINIPINRRNHVLHGKKVFHFAIESGQLEMIQIFIEKFPYLLKEEIFGEAPLIVAVKAKQLKVVKYLLDKSADPNILTDKPHHEDNKKSPLFWAVVNNDIEMVKLLIRSGAMDLHEYGEDKNRVIHLATKRNQLEIIKILTQHLPDLNYIADHHYSIELARNYIKNLPMLCNQKNAYDETPLHLAAQQGHHEVVKFLLDNKANPNVKINRPKHEQDGKTPLDLAFEQNHLQIVALLFRAHKKLNSLPHKTSILSIKMRLMKFAIQERDLELVKILLHENEHKDKLLNLEYNDNYFQGETLLFWAYRNDKADLVALLVKHGANVILTGRKGDFSPLQFAASYGNLEMVKAMIENIETEENKKFILNQAHSKNITLLMIAVEKSQIDIVKYLLEQGADPYTESATLYSSQAITPLALAANKQKKEVVNLLLSKMKNKFLNDHEKLKRVLDTVLCREISHVLTQDELITFNQQLKIIDDKNKVLRITKNNNGKGKVTEIYIYNETNFEKMICLLEKSDTVSVIFSHASPNVIAQCFAMITPYVNQVTHLEFSDCSLSHDLMKYMAFFISHYESSLTSLQFTNVPCDAINIELLSDALLNHSSLKELYFSTCQIDAKGASSLAKMLFINDTLLTLSLPNNNIGDDGALSFAFLLTHGAKISSLGLSKNNISLKGTEKFVECFRYNTKLQKLILFGNEVSLTTQDAINRNLARNIRLNGGWKEQKELKKSHASTGIFGVFSSFPSRSTISLQKIEPLQHNETHAPSRSHFRK